MPRITLSNVDVEFPIFTGKGRSLKGALLPRSVGGEIKSEFDTRKTVVRALNGISLEINDGERVALIGRNGSGKTTLLRVLSKIYFPTSGEAQIDGTITSMTDLIMGMDLEESGYDNIRMRAIFLGLDRRRTEAVIDDVEQFTELGEFLSLPIRTYSQGMLLRLCFGVSTSVAPDVVIMDEMISVGDAAFFAKAEKRLDKLFETARILAIATHDRTTVTRFCNRAIILESGNMLFDGSPEEALAFYDERLAGAEALQATSYFSAQPPERPDGGEEPVIVDATTSEVLIRGVPLDSGLAAAGDSVNRLRDWCRKTTLPFWHDTGFDRSQRSFHERTTFAGVPVTDVPRRTMVQCRQIYAFAHAAQLGWYAEGAETAVSAAETLISRHWRGDGGDGFVFSVDPAGKPHDDRRDAYAHAFGAFALAYAYRISPDPSFRAVADATFALCDTLLAAHDFGGVVDGVPRPDALRRQNPHMHLLEACLAWYETTGEARYLARAGEIVGLFSTRFFHPAEGALGEYFDDSWLPASGDTGKLCEPGHHFEWTWLLRRYAKASGRGLDRYADALFDHARRFGVDERDTVVEEILMDGRPSKTSSRCWQQTEALKAAVAEHERGRPDMAAFAGRTADVLLDRFLGKPFAAGWIDNIEADSTPKVDFVPASTLYHVLLAAAEADRVFGYPAPETAGVAGS